jgi:hypothetical protein
LTASVASGWVPLNVTFLLEISAEGKAAWSFDADGDGRAELKGVNASLSRTFHAQFATVGRYNATLSASDGGTSAKASVTIEARFEPRAYSGAVAVPCSECFLLLDPFPPCAGLASNQNGTDCVWFGLPATAEGQPFNATSLRPYIQVDFLAHCKFGENSLARTSNVPATGNGTGKVPKGARCVVLASDSSSNTLRVAIGDVPQ